MKLILALLFWFQAQAVTVTAKVRGLASDAPRIARIHALTPIVEKVLNSPEFEARMLKASKFQDSNESPESVLAKLKGSNWEQEYELQRQRSRKVLGWTYPSVKTVWFNSRNFDGRDDCGLVGTRFHEESHKRGYRHANAGRSMSVPYYTGTQASLVCKGLK
jgi:hypothetical protein